MAIVLTLEVDDKGTPKIIKFTNTTTNDLKKLENTSKKTSSSMTGDFNKIGDAAYKTTTTIAKFSVGLAAVSFVAFATGMTFIIDKAADLEQKLDYLGAVLKDKTEQGMIDATKTILDLGASTIFTASQVAAGAEQLAKAGFSTAEIIATLPGVTNLAAAATLGLTEAASITSTALRQFNIDASESSKVADILASVATKTKTTVEGLGIGLRYVGPLAHLAGLSLQETTAAMGLLGNAGIEASLAGTSLRAAIARLLAPTKQQSMVMKELGLNIQDSDGKLITMTEVLRQLENAGANTSDVLRLFGLRGGPGMAALLSIGSKALGDFTAETEVAGGTADRIAKEKLSNFRGQLIILNSAFDNFMISLGSPMLGYFSDIITNTLIPALQGAVKWAEQNSGQIEEFGMDVSIFMRDSIATSGQFVGFLQSFVLPAVSTVFTTIGESIGYAATALKFFIDIYSGIGDKFNKLPEFVQTFLKLNPLTFGFANAIDFASESSSGFSETLGKISTEAPKFGSKLSDLTMGVGDLAYSFNNYMQNLDLTTESIKKDEVETSTLYKTIDGNLNPALEDTNRIFNEAMLMAEMSGESMNYMSNDVQELSNNMNTGTSQMADGWYDVDDAINQAAYSMDSFPSVPDYTKDLGGMAKDVGKTGGVGTSETTSGYTIETPIGELDKFYSDYYDMLRRAGVMVYPAATAGSSILQPFAAGGIVEKPTPAYLAESGPEAVIPLSKLTDYLMVDAMRVQQQVGEGVYGSSYTNNINEGGGVVEANLILDGKVLAKQIIDLKDRNVSGLDSAISPRRSKVKDSTQMGTF